MEQGLAPNASLKAAARTVHAPQAAPLRAPVTGAHVAVRTANQDKTIAAASTVRSIFNFPILTLGLPAMVATAGAWLTGKLKRQRTTAVLGGVGEAVLHGPRTTLGKEALELPANMLETMAKKATEVGGRAEGMAAPLMARSDKLRASVQGMQAGFGRAVEKMPNVAQKVLGYVGNKSVGASLAAVAATAGTIVIWSKRTKAAELKQDTLHSIEQALGAGHPLVLSARGIENKSGKATALASVVETGGEYMNVVFEAMPQLGMGTLMAMGLAQSGLGSATEAFIPENAVADAWVRAQQPNAPAKERIYAYSQLIGALPQAQQHGGARNKASVGMAQLLVEKNASFAEVTAILREPVKFEALAKELVEKQHVDAKAAPQGTAQPVMHAAAPAAKISNVAHQGHVQPSVAKVQTAPASHAGHAARVEHHAAAESAHTAR